MQTHILEEWRIRGIEQKAERATSRLYELDSLRRDVDSLEYTCRELSRIVDELRYELQRQADKIEQYESTQPTE